MPQSPVGPFLTDTGFGPWHLVLAHGAGAPMDSPFMSRFAAALAGLGVTVHRFEFAYMAQRRSGGKKRPPAPIAELANDYRAAIADLTGHLRDTERLLIGGKSMGGRVAATIADDLYATAGPVCGLICLGYPFHPQGRPDTLRTDHLKALSCPTLVVQGERDALGSQEEIAGYALSSAISLHWIGDGDHDFVPRGRSGLTKSGNIDAAARAVAAFADALPHPALG